MTSVFSWTSALTWLNIHSFIHSGHFYNATSSPLLLRGAPDYSKDTVSEFHAEAHRQLQVKDLPKVPRAGVKTTTLRLKAIDSTKAPPCPTVSSTARTCLYHLRRIRQVRRCLNETCRRFLVHALAISRLDYCNSVLSGLPSSTLQPLSSVLHTAARLIKDL